MTRKEAERFLKIYKSGKYTLIYPFYETDDYHGMVLIDIVKNGDDLIAFLSIPEDENFGEFMLVEELEVEDVWILKKVNFSRIKKV